MAAKTWVVCKMSYDYHEFCEVLFAGSISAVKKWLSQNSTELPIVYPGEDLPKKVTHHIDVPVGSYNYGWKREEPAQHWRIEEF